MQLNWSTFLLEAVNFVILVWILKRFLYRPVLEVIARRKEAIDKTLADAGSARKQAEELEQQYQNRLADWGREKEQLRSGLTEELRARRERLMADLQAALEEERNRDRVLAARRLREREDHAADVGIARGLQFTSRLLERIAGPELESRLAGMAAEDLLHLPEAQIKALRTACRDSQRGIRITSAFPLPETQRRQVVEALQAATGETVPAAFAEDPSLMAGLRISAGPWTVRANLSDELQFFAGMVRDDVHRQ